MAGTAAYRWIEVLGLKALHPFESLQGDPPLLHRQSTDKLHFSSSRDETQDSWSHHTSAIAGYDKG